MRTLLTTLALLVPLVALAPTAAAADGFPVCAAPDYCLDYEDGTACYTVNLGDMEGPYTRCETVAALQGLPGECEYGDRYCYEVGADGVCATYDLGDLEGPYTTCVGSPSAAGAGPICTTDLIESVGVCVGNGCVVVYLGPSATPFCVVVAEPDPVCTYDLIESVAVCVGTECVVVYLGPSATPICLRR